MKFGLLYELQMPKPEGSAQWGPQDEYRRVQEALAQIAHADKLGFDYLFAVEHHFLEEFSHSSAPEIFLAAASQHTKRMRIGHGIMLTIPRYNHPARCAERIAMLDLISGGRAEFGAGESASDTELGGFGVPREKKGAMWAEATREICKMLTQVPYPGFKGDYFSMPARNVVPKPIQKPHPPLWMAASSKGATLAAARRGMGAFAFGIETAEDLLDRRDEYFRLVREECTPIGYAINPAINAVFSLSCFENEQEAIEKSAAAVEFFAYAMGHHYSPGHEPGKSTIFTQFQQLPQPTRTAMAQAVAKNFIGTPAQLHEKLRGFEEAHLDLILFMVQMGNRRHQDIMDSLERFATKVMPEFKERHAQHQAWRSEQLAGVQHPINSSI